MITLHKTGTQVPGTMLVSTWDAGQGKLTDWELSQIQQDAEGIVAFTLSKSPAGYARPYIGAEIQDNKTRRQFGTWFTVAKAPKMQPGVIWSPLFTYQHNGTSTPWTGPWREFDFEWVGTKGLQLTTHMTGDDGTTKHTGHGTFDLLFDPSADFHLYELNCQPTFTEFKVDGKVLFTATPANVGAWNTVHTVAYADLWMTESVGWAGDHTKAVLPITGYVKDFGYRADPVVVTPPAPVEPPPVVVVPDPVVVPPVVVEDKEYTITGTIGGIPVNLTISRKV